MNLQDSGPTNSVQCAFINYSLFPTSKSPIQALCFLIHYHLYPFATHSTFRRRQGHIEYFLCAFPSQAKQNFALPFGLTVCLLTDILQSEGTRLHYHSGFILSSHWLLRITASVSEKLVSHCLNQLFFFVFSISKVIYALPLHQEDSS